MLNLKQTLRAKNDMSARRGATLIEMLVYAAVFAMVFTGIYMIFNASVKYYYVTQANVWVQQNSLSAINQLSREVAESSTASVAFYTSTPKGVVFMSPRKTDGTLTYNTASGYEGKPYWQKYIAYYMYADPQDSSKNLIYRKEIAVTQTDSATQSTIYTTSYFATGAGSTLSYKVIASNITDFDVYWLSGSTKTYTTPPINPVYISITAQDDSIGKSNTMTTISSIDVPN